jgi:dGTPase
MVEKEHANVDEKFLFNEALQLMQNVLTDDLIDTTRCKIAAIGAESLADIRRHPTRLAVFSPQVETERLQEKRYLYDSLYTCEPLETEHDKAEQVVTALFDYWINDPEELPVSYFDEVENEGLARVVADYIAGMTDTFILQQYALIKRAVRF